MNNDEAKMILGSYRAQGQDAGDTFFCEALLQAERDPSLGDWLRKEQARDAGIAELFATMPVPPAGRAQALAAMAASRGARDWWRPLALAASLAHFAPNVIASVKRLSADAATLPPIDEELPEAVNPPPPNPIDEPREPAVPVEDSLANHLNVSVIATAPGSPLIATYRRDASRRPATDEIRIWTIATGKLQRTIDQPHQADAMAMSDDGRWLISMGRRGTQAQVMAWDLADGSVAASLNIAESFGSVAFAGDGRHAWLLCPSDGFRTLDLQARQFQRAIDMSPHAYLAQFSGPRKLAAVKCNRAAGGGAEQWIDVYDLASGAHLQKLNPGGLIGSFALAPDGHAIALGFRDRIEIHETRRWRKAAAIQRAGVNAPQRLLFSTDSTRLIELPFGVDGPAPVIHDLKAGTHVKLNTKPCTDWGFGPGNRLYLASERSPVRVFEMTGDEVK